MPYHIIFPLIFSLGGGGSIEASLIIIESINHMVKGASRLFSCFLDLHKAWDTVRIDDLSFKLFNEFGVRDKMWLAIRDEQRHL